MKRTVILVALMVLVVASFLCLQRSLAEPFRKAYSGPDWGKDPPPKKIVGIISSLFA